MKTKRHAKSKEYWSMQYNFNTNGHERCTGKHNTRNATAVRVTVSSAWQLSGHHRLEHTARRC